MFASRQLFLYEAAYGPLISCVELGPFQIGKPVRRLQPVADVGTTLKMLGRCIIDRVWTSEPAREPVGAVLWSIAEAIGCGIVPERTRVIRHAVDDLANIVGGQTDFRERHHVRV